MRKYFGVAAVAVFILALGLAFYQGGNDPFVSPVSSIPSILIDYNLNETGANETEIFVKGLNDFRFTNMSLRVTTGNQTFERARDKAYFMFYNTSVANFTFNIIVWNKNKQYSFNGSLQVASPDEAPKLLTLYEEKRDRINTYVLNTANLPWKKLMERVR
jgi:fucose permease